MKKYLFGLSALALAIAFSAFTKAKPTSLHTMQLKSDFLGDPDSYDLVNGIIDDPDNWEEAAPSFCTGSNNYACQFQIDDNDCDNKKYFHYDGNGKVVMNKAADADVGPNVPGVDDKDGDGCRDIETPKLCTADGNKPVPGSSPTRWYQILTNWVFQHFVINFNF